MFGSRDLRAAALCFGLAGIGAWPDPKGAFAIEDAAHVLGCYRYDLADLFVIDRLQVTAESCAGPSITGESSQGASITNQTCAAPSISSEASS